MSAYGWETYKELQKEELVIDGRNAAIELAGMPTSTSVDRIIKNKNIPTNNHPAKLLKAIPKDYDKGISFSNNKIHPNPMTTYQNPEGNNIQQAIVGPINGNASDQTDVNHCIADTDHNDILGCKSCMSLIKEQKQFKEQTVGNLRIFKEKILGTSELVAEFHQKSKDLEKYKQKLKAVTARLESCYGESGALRIQLEKALQANEPLKKTLKRFEREKALLDTEIKNLNEELKRSESEISKMKEAVVTSRVSHEDIRKEKEENNKEFEKEKKKVLKQADLIDKLNAKLKEARVNSKLKEKELKTALRANNQLQSKLDKASQKLNSGKVKGRKVGENSIPLSASLLQSPPSSPSSPQSPRPPSALPLQQPPSPPILEEKKKNTKKKKNVKKKNMASNSEKCERNIRSNEWMDELKAIESVSSQSSVCSSSSEEESGDSADEDKYQQLREGLAQALEDKSLSPSKFDMIGYMSPPLSPIPPSPVPSRCFVRKQDVQRAVSSLALSGREIIGDDVDREVTSYHHDDDVSIFNRPESSEKEMFGDVDDEVASYHCNEPEPESSDDDEDIPLANFLRPKHKSQDIEAHSHVNEENSEENESETNSSKGINESDKNNENKNESKSSNYDSTEKILESITKSTDFNNISSSNNNISISSDNNISSSSNNNNDNDSSNLEDLSCGSERKNRKRKISDNENERKKVQENQTKRMPLDEHKDLNTEVDFCITQTNSKQYNPAERTSQLNFEKANECNKYDSDQVLPICNDTPTTDGLPNNSMNTPVRNTSLEITERNTITSDTSVQTSSDNTNKTNTQETESEPDDKEVVKRILEEVIEEVVVKTVKKLPVESHASIDHFKIENESDKMTISWCTTENNISEHTESTSSTTPVKIITESENNTVCGKTTAETASNRSSPVAVKQIIESDSTSSTGAAKTESQFKRKIFQRSVSSEAPSKRNKTSPKKCLFIQQSKLVPDISVDEVDSEVASLELPATPECKIKTKTSKNHVDTCDRGASLNTVDDSMKENSPLPFNYQSPLNETNSADRVIDEENNNQVINSPINSVRVQPSPWQAKRVVVSRRHSMFVRNETWIPAIRDRSRSYSPHLLSPPSPPLSPMPPSPRRNVLTPMISPLPLTPLPHSLSPLPPSPKITSPPLIRGSALIHSENNSVRIPVPLSHRRSTAIQAINFTKQRTSHEPNINSTNMIGEKGSFERPTVKMSRMLCDGHQSKAVSKPTQFGKCLEAPSKISEANTQMKSTLKSHFQTLSGVEKAFEKPLSKLSSSSNTKTSNVRVSFERHQQEKLPVVVFNSKTGMNSKSSQETVNPQDVSYKLENPTKTIKKTEKSDVEIVKQTTISQNKPDTSSQNINFENSKLKINPPKISYTSMSESTDDDTLCVVVPSNDEITPRKQRNFKRKVVKASCDSNEHFKQKVQPASAATSTSMKNMLQHGADSKHHINPKHEVDSKKHNTDITHDASKISFPTSNMFNNENYISNNAPKRALKKRPKIRKQHFPKLPERGVTQTENEYAFTALKKLISRKTSKGHVVRAFRNHKNISKTAAIADGFIAIAKQCKQVLIPQILKDFERGDDSCHNNMKPKKDEELAITLRKNSFYVCHPNIKSMKTPVITADEKILLSVLKDLKGQPRYNNSNSLSVILQTLMATIWKGKQFIACEILSLCRLYACICRLYDSLDPLVLFLYNMAFDQPLKINFSTILITCYTVWPKVLMRQDLLESQKSLTWFKVKLSPLSSCFVLLGFCDAVASKMSTVNVKVLEHTFAVDWQNDYGSKENLFLMKSLLEELYSLLKNKELSYVEEFGYELNPFAFSCMKAIQLLCVNIGWEWTYNHMIVQRIWIDLKTLIFSEDDPFCGNNASCSSAAILIRLIGQLVHCGIGCGYQDFTELSNVIISLLWKSSGLDALQYSAAFTLLDIAPTQSPDMCRSVLLQWKEQSRKNDVVIPNSLDNLIEKLNSSK